MLGNEYNPEFLKLQDEFNEKERENLMLQDKIDALQQAFTEQQTHKFSQIPHMKNPQRSDVLNQSINSGNDSNLLNLDDFNNSFGDENNFAGGEMSSQMALQI